MAIDSYHHLAATHLEGQLWMECCFRDLSSLDLIAEQSYYQTKSHAWAVEPSYVMRVRFG